MCPTLLFELRVTNVGLNHSPMHRVTEKHLCQYIAFPRLDRFNKFHLSAAPVHYEGGALVVVVASVSMTHHQHQDQHQH